MNASSGALNIEMRESLEDADAAAVVPGISIRTITIMGPMRWPSGG